MSVLSAGEKWIRLLRAYGPVADNEAMQTENVDKLSKYLGIPKLSFEHPVRKLLLDCFPVSSGLFRNVVLTGTAGDGKTSLCYDLVQALTGKPARGNNGLEQVVVETAAGPLLITLIYDFTGWRKKTGGYLTPEHVAVLGRMAASAFHKEKEFFVLAVNDGQMHSLFRALPPDAPESLRKLESTLIGLHARGESDAGDRLRLINLSTVPSEQLMTLCLGAVLDRPEWRCLEDERERPLFSEASSLARNYKALTSPETRTKLITFARIADVTRHHLPTRGVLCLLANALLGHPKARDRVIRPGLEGKAIAVSEAAHQAALHKTLFGENLTQNIRRKREIYRFFSMLHVGDQTTSDLDELLIFGKRDAELRAAYDELVEPDPYHQRNPGFDELLKRYIRGDIILESDTSAFLVELAAERRRVFLQASHATIKKYSLWRTSVFHYAHEYLDGVLEPLQQHKSAPRVHLRKLAAGLNRTWTGQLLADNATEVYFATGLDLTTSAVSDIYLSQLELDSDPPGMRLELNAASGVPDLVLQKQQAEFRFALTMPRFEFLYRVADGAMPSSFSRESCADFMSLKQRCLRDLGLKSSTRSLHLLEVQGAGTVQRLPIHLGES